MGKDKALKGMVNELVNSCIRYQVIINSLKHILPQQKVYDIFKHLNSGPYSINRNFLNFLKDNDIKGASKYFVRKSLTFDLFRLF